MDTSLDDGERNEALEELLRGVNTDQRHADTEEKNSDLTSGFTSVVPFEEDAQLDITTDEVQLDGLVEELELWGDHEVINGILSKGVEVGCHVREVDGRLREVELASIEDYIHESDNLMHLHNQIKSCDGILQELEHLLGGFQSDLGNISSEIKSLQEQSMTMSIKLKNRKVAEAELGAFVEAVTVPPRMVSEMLDGKEVSEEYLGYLVALREKLEFCATDPLVRKAAALQDVEPELERLRVRAVGRVRDFLLSKMNLLRRPKTNIQILQQSVLLKHKQFVAFLKDHGPEAFPEVRSAYVDTMGRIYRGALSGYVSSLSRIQAEVAGKGDMLGSEEHQLSSLTLFPLAKGAHPANRGRTSVFALAGRDAILNQLESSPPLVIHSVAASGAKYAFEVLFRSSSKLLMDAACAEYVFCEEFWTHDQSVFRDLFEGTLQTMQEHLRDTVANYFDAIGLFLMIRINYDHQLMMQKRCIPCLDAYIDKVNLLLWPRLKSVADLHIDSLKTANMRNLWQDDVHAHYVARRYAELTASLLQLNQHYGDPQIDHILERLRGGICEALLKLSNLFRDPRSRALFLLNNYDIVLTVLKEARLGGDGGGDRSNTSTVFEELLAGQTHVFVEEELKSHFGPFVAFVKKAELELSKQATSAGSVASGVDLAEALTLMRDFAERWKRSIEAMHKDAVTNFGNLERGMEILQRTLSQLLIYYTRLTGAEGVLSKCGPRGVDMCKEAISHPSFIYEIKLKLKL